MMAESHRRKAVPTKYMYMSGRSGTWIADEEEARGVALRSSAEWQM